MRDDELAIRLRRIYAAIDASEKADLSKVPPKVIVSKDLVAISQEFSGDLREEDISNIAHQVIHNVANLRDNLHRWATAQAKDPQRVWDTFNASQSIKIIQDLSNNDKHSYPPKKGYGNSGIAPKLTEIKRSLRLTANPGEGICVLFGPAGIRTDGNGTAKVIVTGQIIDKDGKPIGDLYTVEIEALIAWEVLLREYDAPIGEDVKSLADKTMPSPARRSTGGFLVLSSPLRNNIGHFLRFRFAELLDQRDELHAPWFRQAIYHAVSDLRPDLPSDQAAFTISL